MKKLIYVTCFLTLLWACNTENAPDCLQKAGELAEVTLDVDPFSSVEVNSAFDVVISEGTEQQVTLTIGSNLLNEIQYAVTDGTLSIANNNSCNWARAYDLPVLHIIHPNLKVLRQGSSGLIRSDGVLHYPSLSLTCVDQSGDFDLQVDCDRIYVNNNSLCNIHLTGQTRFIKIGVYSGDGRFEGADLQASKVEVFHRGSNDIIVHATDTLTGRIISAGNLIYVKTTPAVIDVSIENLGKLIDKTE